MSTTSIYLLSDKLLSEVFQNLADLADFQNCRLVSQKWKRNVMVACRSKFHLVYPLTDSTLYATKELKKAIVSFDVYSFTGKENKDAWSASRIGPLMRTTEWLQFSGNGVSTTEIRKILHLSHNSLTTLSFKCIKKDLTCSFLKMEESFSVLRKISLGYFGSQKENDTFKRFTSTLEKWNSLDCRVQLPLLESLNLYYDSRARTDAYTYVRVTSEELFRNYLAIGKLLLKYKQTLREVQIKRISIEFFHAYSHEVRPEWAEMGRGLEALDDLNLNRLKVTHKPACFRPTGHNTFSGVDIELFGRPKNLNNLLYQTLMWSDHTWRVLTATLPKLNNVEDSYLTCIKISLNLWILPDPTIVINFEVLKKCMSLRKLFLNVNSPGIPVWLSIKNIEFLPKGVRYLRLQSTNNLVWSMGQDIHISQDQIHWIIDNLRELESFWVSLVIPRAQTDFNENNVQGQGEDAAAENNGDNDDDAHDQQQEDAILVNISLDTFRDLIAMPKLKYLSVIMMNARAIIDQFLNWHVEPANELDAILNAALEYSDLCEASGYSTTTSSSLTKPGTNLGFVTLTIRKNEKL